MKTYQCCVCNGNIFLHSGLRMGKHVQINVHAFYAFETQISTVYALNRDVQFVYTANNVLFYHTLFLCCNTMTFIQPKTTYRVHIQQA